METTRVSIRRVDPSDQHSDEANSRRAFNNKALAYKVKGLTCIALLNLPCKGASYSDAIMKQMCFGEEVTGIEFYENGAMNLIISDASGQIAYIRVRP